MNWNKIKEKYPKAEKILQEWLSGRYDWNTRDLYDFFDEQGIYISIMYTYYWNSLDESDHYHFDWEIMFDTDDKIISAEVEEPTRTEAETIAFEKAFEILENKLEGEK